MNQYDAIEDMFEDSEEYDPVNPVVEKILEDSLNVHQAYQNSICHTKRLENWHSMPDINLLDSRLESNNFIYLIAVSALTTMSDHFDGDLHDFLRSINWTHRMWDDWYSAIQMRSCSEIIRQFAKRYTKYMSTCLRYWTTRGTMDRSRRAPPIRSLFP